MGTKRLYHKPGFSNLALALLSGVLLVAAFPRMGWFPLAWFALVPLLVSIHNVKPLHSFALGLVSGVTFFLGLLYWVSLFGFLPCLLFAFIEALFVAVFALIANRLMDRGWFSILSVPAAWTALEWVRSLSAYGVTWGDLGYSQAPWTGIIQMASVTGVWGVTLAVVAVNVAIAHLILNKEKRTLGVVAGAVALIAVAGQIYSVKTPDSGKSIKVAMIQGGIDLTYPDEALTKQIQNTYWSMTKTVRGADLILWPESAIPGDYEASPYLQKEISSLAKDSGATMIAGGLHAVFDPKAAGMFRAYNGAYAVGSNGRLMDYYYKVHLVPFGEFVPGRNWLPLLDRYGVMEIDKYPGKGFHSVRTEHGRMGMMICFESTFPQISRAMVRDGAKALVVITNDSWFGKTAAIQQHHDFCVLRAVETRRYVARNASTGISSIITPTGRVVTSAGLGKRAIVSGDIRSRTGETFYVRFGDWVPILCGILVMVGFIVPVMSMERPR